MEKSLSVIRFFLLLALLIQGTSGVQYIVTNNVPNLPGGMRFNSELGVPWTIQLMGSINKFIWQVFQQPADADRKPMPVVKLYISDFTSAMGYTNGDNTINISAQSIQSFPPGPQTKFWFISLLVHEMTHIFQWSGKGTAPGGLTEGIADYVMIKSNYYDPNIYTRSGEGHKWDEGYGVTARFLEYCDSLRPGFTTLLNKKMRIVYHDNYFMGLLGKSLPQVWAEYKVKYGNIPADSRDALPNCVRKKISKS